MECQTALKGKVGSALVPIDDKNLEPGLDVVRRQTLEKRLRSVSCLEELRHPNCWGEERRFTHGALCERLLLVSIFSVLIRIAGVIATIGRIYFGTIKHHTKEIFLQKF